ncbi:MAG: folate family ECF transporter S component [bacterium]
MQTYGKTLRESAKALTKVRNLTLCGLLAAMAVALSFVASIDLGPYVRIGFSGIPNRIVDAFFGPVTGALFGGALDIIKFIVKPSGTFFPGFTFDAMLAGFIYGSFYYKKELTLWRVLAAKGVVTVVVNLFFNTLWLSVLGGKAFFALLGPRVLKNIIMWPIESVLFFFLMKGIQRTGLMKRYQGKS